MRAQADVQPRWQQPNASSELGAASVSGIYPTPAHIPSKNSEAQHHVHLRLFTSWCGPRARLTLPTPSASPCSTRLHDNVTRSHRLWRQAADSAAHGRLATNGSAVTSLPPRHCKRAEAARRGVERGQVAAAVPVASVTVQVDREERACGEQRTTRLIAPPSSFVKLLAGG